MSRAAAIRNYFQFNKGLITEATGVSYPENSMRSAVNFDLDFDGSIKRRKGLAFETDHVQDSLSGSYGDSVLVQSFVWDNTGSSEVPTILVLRVGAFLRFYSLEGGAVSNNLLGSITLAPLVANERLCFDKGIGFMLVACTEMDPIAITYENGSFSTHTINPVIRDMVGLDDGLEINERFDIDVKTEYAPAFNDNQPMTPEAAAYVYNRVNGGWPSKKVHHWQGSTRRYAWNIFNMKDAAGLAPAPSDRYIQDDFRYDPRVENGRSASTNTPAVGRLLVDAFNINRGAALNSLPDKGQVVADAASYLEATLPAEVIDKRPSAIGFFQGHVLMGTVPDSDYSSKILISQSVLEVEDIDKCYAVNDPTDDIESSPLDTDGGVITIAGLGKVHSFKVLGPFCVVFSDTGVWVIRSAEDSVFSVNNVTVNKVSEVGCLGPDSILQVESSIYYWTDQGIYNITVDESNYNIGASNISEFTIQRLYNNLSTIQRANAFAAYDKLSRKGYWFYNSTLSSNSGKRSFYDRALVVDGRLGAFYEYHFNDVDEATVQITAPFFKKDLVSVESSNSVVAGTDNVVAGTDDVVVLLSQSSTYEVPALMVTAYTPGVTEDTVTFGLFSDRSFYDWSGVDDYDFPSYVETGHETLEQPAAVKSASYIHCFFNRTEENFLLDGNDLVFDFPSSCLMTAKWEWTGTGTANRWSDPQQVYRFRVPFVPGAPATPFDYDFEVIATRSKIRGHGKALSIRFEAESGKDLQLLGWVMELTAGSKL